MTSLVCETASRVCEMVSRVCETASETDAMTAFGSATSLDGIETQSHWIEKATDAYKTLCKVKKLIIFKTSIV